ncbi:hypothetical protein Daura_29580 [Dactylosporangium aurantiacum]|uniref:Uncharacterized protein n=1 Tax=Dactylosporangium aurantiacum TaxID=35754 RepID=A0A9Q9IAP7_9ACTN|nr:hypothetical protein [Dactylosporangium aurantiacum]MDG6106805.1 hypothetical protein [Dactylosporangium aurantiacum]UWZ50945.1 hypothetical protein Daura_29580 [Dactylosporangium aurantiacum]
MSFHAYGPAGEDLVLLDALRRGDDRPQGPDEPFWRAPYSFLWSALYCGGNLTPATVEAVRYLVRTIPEPRFGGEDPTLRIAAIWFLREVAREALGGVDRATASRRDEPDVREWLTGYLRERRFVLDWTDADAAGQVLLAAARVDCFDLLPEVYAAVEPLLTVREPALRGCASLTAATLSGHPDLVAHRPRLLAHLLAECAAADAHHRASMLLGAGELGGAPREWLRDPHPGVRVCAALAPALADDPAANTVLLTEASKDPDVIGMRGFDGMGLPALPYPQTALAERLCATVRDVDRLLPAAVAAVPSAPTYLNVGERRPARGALAEPYLRVFFPTGLPSPAAATPAQRRLAEMIARHASFREPGSRAEPSSGPPDPWNATFSRLGLPADRSSWQAVAGLT